MDGSNPINASNQEEKEKMNSKPGEDEQVNPLNNFMNNSQNIDYQYKFMSITENKHPDHQSNSELAYEPFKDLDVISEKNEKYFEEEYYNSFRLPRRYINNKFKYTHDQLYDSNYSAILNQLKIQASHNNQFILKLTMINGVDLDSDDHLDTIMPGVLNSAEDITLEFENGYYTLADFLNNYVTSIGIYDKIQILLDICLGIKSIHYNSIAHCDLTLANIVKCDLGWKIRSFSKSMDMTTSNNNNNMVQYLTGSAPELYKDTSNISFPFDIYNFGLIFYELLTGISIELLEPQPTLQNVYIKDNKIKLIDLLNSIMDKHLERNRKLNRIKYKKIILTIYTKCLRSNPNKRIKIDALASLMFELLELYE